MEGGHAAHDKEYFLRALSNYSVCIQPYLRNVQERYVGAYYLVEGQKVDLGAFCKSEYQQVLDAKTKIEGSQ